ncbi:acetyl-CoA synthetase-like protein [Sistotremastrum suecicum HHB10207 ss-3]|uniref:Acetyl-CoA synthetase-like protein n=1 Tax=Sistotremastrum suecicum HHB10207 ss-3 TaxID=1314776 RepID=A0A165YKH2_9AGAM|nr:acetyl-CoA synthetase-like protein [Sistotremastrum suecicum HHB10207 ss-3]
MSSTFEAPSNIRDRLISELFLHAATLNPNHVFAHIIDGDIDQPVVESATWHQLLTQAHSIAKELSKSVEPREPGSPERTIGILARHSYNYVPHVLAVLLNGWSIMFLSTKNSPSAIDHLLEESGSECLLTDRDSRSLVQGCSFAIPILEFYDLASLSSHGLPPSKTITPELLEIEVHKTAYYLHTSGSTGQPKVVPCSHQFYGQCVHLFFSDAGDFRGHPLYSCAPIFHSTGFIFYLTSAPIIGSPIIFANSRKPLNGDALVRHLRPFSNTIIAAIPSLLQEIAGAGEKIIEEFANQAAAVLFAGAGLDAAAGDLLGAHGILLKNIYGSSEIGSVVPLTLPKVPLLDGDWNYVQWRNVYKMHLIPVEGSDARELIVEPGLDIPAVINNVIPRGFRTRDTWVEHSTKSGWWRHAGRLDDVSVLSNGLKTNNKQLEALLRRDRRIQHVIIFGQGRSQNGILVDPAPGTQDPRSFIDDIWPTIVAMNKEVPLHSCLIRELVLVASPNRPFSLTDKGTVRVKTTLSLYEQDIESAYLDMENGESSSWQLPVNIDAHSIEMYIINAIPSGNPMRAT